MERTNGIRRCPVCEQVPTAVRLDKDQYLIECTVHPKFQALGNSPKQAFVNWNKFITTFLEG